MKCRHCGAELSLPLVDLGMAPPSNAYLTVEALQRPERRFPLRVLVCERCWLVQTEDFTDADELFDADYAYFSGVSTSWLAHAERYVADMIARFGLHARSRVVEVAANDGYLLQYVKARGIPCTGVEPTASTAAAARAKGIEIVQDFFGRRLAEAMAGRGLQADLMSANNVLAHVPDINDFVAGFATLLKPGGVATFEFPHLLRLMAEAQFDTIYHEHFSYLSLTAVRSVFERVGLQVFDVQEWPTHGGSLRVFAQRTDAAAHAVTPAVGQMLGRETEAGVRTAAYYRGLQPRAERIRDDLLKFLRQAKAEGRTVIAYGAAAKGNTLLNFAGVGPELLRCVVDLNPAKQGKFMPGSRIPIVGRDELIARRPDDLLILPWNLIAEIREQHKGLARLGTRFVVAVPRLVTA
ncbi:MAG: class I SAM-dependent methyltransferase [Planctomycetes bacterium]|nr:class I SAM-dependent methyltransferase [Planctomycetota bacterium]